MATTNKYGLSRYIPTKIKEKIRKDAGFGCVLCGCVLVDYEHIDPEWAVAKEHNPNNMTILCIQCHGRVTRKLISKDRIWEAKSSPKALETGYSHDILFCNTDNMEILIGNLIFKNTKVILSIAGKPIIWFEPPFQKNEPSKLCAIFYNEQGKVISYINRNQFIAMTDNQDVKSESTELVIIASNKKRLLIDREGDKTLHIKKLEGSYLNTSVTINKDGHLLITQGSSTYQMGKLIVDSCHTAISLGDLPKKLVKNKLNIALQLIADNHKKIYNYSGIHIGWIFQNQIFDKKYSLVGICKDEKVFTLTNEYIGDYIHGKITYKDDSYLSGEPIFISQNNRVFKTLGLNNTYDLSFRLFGENI